MNMKIILGRQSFNISAFKGQCLSPFLPVRMMAFFGKTGKDPETKDEPSQPTEVEPPKPRAVYTARTLQNHSKFNKPKETWVENLDTIEREKIGLVHLHPDIFGAYPRVHAIHANVVWQELYKKVDYSFMPSRAEMRGGGRKPWPQKGLGKARHGSRRSPIFMQGAKAHGPRGPKTYYYNLEMPVRLEGLIGTLTCKFVQNDLKIVDNLQIPTEDPKYVEELTTARGWGASVLFVDNTDFMPKNISLALKEIPHMNLMPVYGLNVHSMLKHDTLVLTLEALDKIEERLLFNLKRTDINVTQEGKRSSFGYF